jgi:GNAT superfamily N-acetyltransferase
MKIRNATAADVPSVLPMVRAICEFHEARDPERFGMLPDVVERYERWLPERARDARSVFLVAEGADEDTEVGGPISVARGPSAARCGLMGFVVCTVEAEIPIFRVRECGWVHDLYVKPEARRGGVGRALVRGVIERFGEIGVEQIRLHTGVFNEDARKLFAAEGFRASVVEMLRAVG